MIFSNNYFGSNFRDMNRSNFTAAVSPLTNDVVKFIARYTEIVH